MNIIIHGNHNLELSFFICKEGDKIKFLKHNDENCQPEIVAEH